MSLYKKVALRYLLANEEAPVEDAPKGINIDIANRVKENLKNKKYKSESSGNEISFNTAYNQKHQQALDDFKKEFAKVLEDAQKKEKPKEDSSDSDPKDTVPTQMSDEEADEVYKKILKEVAEENSNEPTPPDPIKSLPAEAQEMISDPQKVYEEGAKDEKVKEKIVKNIDFDIEPYNDSTPKKGQRAENIEKSFSRFNSLKQEDRSDVVNSFKEKLKDQNLSDSERESLKDSLGSLVASRIMNGDKGAPPSDPLFTKVLRGTKSESLRKESVKLIAEMSQAESNGSKRQLKKEFFNNLSDGDFLDAIGGSDSPYGKLAEKMNPNFCPSSPQNGDMGGKVVGADECPVPLSDSMRSTLREHITTMMMDGMVFRETEGGGEEKEQPKEEKSQLNEWLDGASGKDFMQDLIDGNDVTSHVVQMRSENAKASTPSNAHAQRVQERLISIGDDGGSTDAMDSLFEFEEDDRPKREDFETEEDFRVALSYHQMSKMGHIRRGSLNVVSKYIDNLFITPSNTHGGNKMINKNSTVYVDYQQRAKGFEIGMRVFPFFEGNPNKSGIVRAVFPAIGMVDVQFPHGSTRLPVEDLVVDTSGDVSNVKMDEDSVPGGLGSYPVSTGAKKVASLHMKKAIYWKERNRKYKKRKHEDHPHCPKCRDVKLKNTSYKRRNGLSEHLLGCPSCLFLIKSTDII